MKPPATTAVSRAPAARPAVSKAARGSIASMKEIQEDGGKVEELQAKVSTQIFLLVGFSNR